MQREQALIGRILDLLKEFGKNLSRPEQKFLCDLVVGILSSQSCLLSEIARAISSRETLPITYQRLDLNLGKYDLQRAYERAQNKMLSCVREDFLLVFDPSEIVKPFGKKMEGLAFVRDGSVPPRLVWDKKLSRYKEAPVLAPGYPLRVAVALSSVGDVLPLELSLYSTASEFFSSNNEEYIVPLTNLSIRTQLKSLLVLDREFDSYIIIRHLCGLNQKFVIRLKENRKYRLPEEKLGPGCRTFTREEISQPEHQFLKTKSIVTYTRRGLSESHLFEFSASHVALLSEFKKEHAIREKGDDELLTLIRLRIYKDTGMPTLYLLTNARPQTETELEKIGRAYLARWNIEEYIRFLKQHFEMESFLVRDLGRMKNLISAVYIATTIIHLLTDRQQVRGNRAHHFLIQNSREVARPKLTRDFFLYSYGRGLAQIVARNKLLLRNPHNYKKSHLDLRQKPLPF
jgi:hypothetical protein